MSTRATLEASPHTHRFRTATAVLIGCAIAAIVIAVSAAVSSPSRSGTTSGQAWSSFVPPENGPLGARDIAGYVAPTYRISPVAQLAVVTVLNLESAAAAAASAAAATNGTAGAGASASASGLQIAVHPSPTSSAVAVLPGSTIGYNLCGIGAKNCAIGIGTPSSSRLLLLRREALELALYTFRYLPSVQNVVAILPPGHTLPQSTLSRQMPTTSTTSKPLNVAVLFLRSELRPLLAVPLKSTLPETAPPTISEMPTAPEAALVSQLTGHGLFSEQLQQAQDGSNLIVLDPLAPQ